MERMWIWGAEGGNLVKTIIGRWKEVWMHESLDESYHTIANHRKPNWQELLRVCVACHVASGTLSG